MISDFENGGGLVSNLDIMRGPYLLARKLIFMQYNPEEAFRTNVKQGKIQKEVPPNTPFPCQLNNTRSVEIPTSVHKLRPGDIDVIAVIGDSSSAGTSVITTNIQQMLYESRGVVFSGGGRGNWRRFLTLPNILKVFNPKLYGYSIADSLTVEANSRLNVAEPTIMSRDLLFQAKVLVRRMRHDPNVDMQRHWKILTLFVGNVDFCGDLCTYNDIAIPLRLHERDLHTTLTYLRKNVPRLFVNLLPAPNAVKIFHKMKHIPMTSVLVHRVFCGCVMNATYDDTKRNAYEDKIHLWQDVDAYIARLPEFDTEDFAVVFQPFSGNPQPPVLPNGDIDLRFFASDCFHFSQLGHATLANTLWNNMLQPIGNKQLSLTMPFERFECPTEDTPYLATRRNSF